MRKLTFTNSSGTSIEFYKTPYLIETLDGVDTPAVAVQEQKAPYQDGTTYIDSLLDNRQIVITGAIVKPKVLGDIATARAAMQSILNPKLGLGTITFQNDSLTRYATGYVSSCLLPNKDARDPYQRFQVTITCPDPFWYGAEVTVTGGGFGMFSRTLPNSASWKSIAYGDGVFCAVSGSTAIISTDGGNTWAQKSTGTSLTISSIAYGGGTFIAVATGIENKCVVSSDGGNTWTEKTMSSSQDWGGITYGNGVFVAVGTASAVAAISADNGNTWTNKTLPASRFWYGVSYGNGVFVTVADSTDKLAISTNGGNTWTEKTMPSSAGWNAVAYGNGVFIATALSSNKAAVSSDGGNTWAAKTLSSTNSWWGIAYGNGVFIAVASGGSPTTEASLSKDNGATWQALTLPLSRVWQGIAYGSGTFGVTGQATTDFVAITGSIINIASELSAPVEIQIDGPNGATAITNNEETLSVSKTLVTGEKILINTKFGQRSIYFYPISGARTNAMQYLDVDSVFWQLQPGYNNVFFTSPATLRYRERYIGV